MPNCLEDIIGIQNIIHPDTIPNNYEDRTKGLNPEIDPSGFICASVNFQGFGIDYKASDLQGYGLDSTCATCPNHYTIVFVDNNIVSKSYIMKNGKDRILILPIDDDIADGHQFCKYIVDEINKPENNLFIQHFQQYVYLNECLYVYDNRNKDLGSFFTSVHVIPIGVRATYEGPSVQVSKEYDIKYVKVLLINSNGKSFPLNDSEWTPSSLTISVVGLNTFTAVYNQNTDLFGEYFVKGYWTEIKAEYIGQDVLVQEYYDTHDVEVKASFGDGTSRILEWEELIWEEDLYVNDNGLLKKFVTYIDEYGDKCISDYYVPGIPRPISLRAKYLGIMKGENTKVQKGEVQVYITYLLNDFNRDDLQIEEKPLTQDEWEFMNGNIVNKDNNGILMIKLELLISSVYFYFITSIQVKLIDATHSYLIAWYEGPAIEVGETYDLRHVIVYYCEPGKDRIQLHYLDPGVKMNRDMVIRKAGYNTYTVMYIYDRWSFTTEYYVPGIVSKKYPDKEFKVVYIEKDTFKETDLTEDFRNYFTYKNAFVISWNQFMLCVRDYVSKGLPYLGMFRLDAPKCTGLWNKYASSWHVYVLDAKNLKAEIYKIYSDPIEEEDEEDGKTKENIPGADN